MAGFAFVIALKIVLEVVNDPEKFGRSSIYNLSLKELGERPYLTILFCRVWQRRTLTRQLVPPCAHFALMVPDCTKNAIKRDQLAAEVHLLGASLGD